MKKDPNSREPINIAKEEIEFVRARKRVGKGGKRTKKRKSKKTKLSLSKRRKTHRRK